MHASMTDGSDQETSTSSDNDRDDEVYVLLTFKDHDREARARKGLGLSDLRKLAEKTFSDLPSTADFFATVRFKYKSDLWDGRWIDVTPTFECNSKRLEIKLLNTEDPPVEPQQKKLKLMEAIRAFQNKGVQKKKTSIREKVTIGIGWKEYENKTKCYKQVRSQCGGGTLSLTVARTINYDTMMKLCQDKFFPNGRSANGISLHSREFFLGNNQGLSFEDDFILDQLYKETPKLKVYLHSKQRESESSTSSSLPDPELYSVESDIEDLSTDQILNAWPVNAQENSDAPVVVEDAHVVCASDPSTSNAGDSGHVGATNTGEHFVSAGTPTVQAKTSGVPMCTVCMIRPKDAFIECGHTFCAPCLYHLQELQQPTCPQCRSTFEKVQTLYF